MADPNDTMLTTEDNPFSPFEQWDDWLNYDETMGYNTCAYLARIVASSDELSDADEALAIDQGMQEIVEMNLLGNYVIVTKDSVANLIANRKK